MRQHGFNVGGEQSGHIVLGEFGTTGDGLVAALQVLALAVAADRPIGEVCRRFQPLPQVLRNVRYTGASPLNDAGVQQALAQTEAELAGRGRLLVRPSGTEPVIRVMAEGDDEALVGRSVEALVALMQGVVRDAGAAA